MGSAAWWVAGERVVTVAAGACGREPARRGVGGWRRWAGRKARRRMVDLRRWDSVVMDGQDGHAAAGRTVFFFITGRTALNRPLKACIQPTNRNAS